MWVTEEPAWKPCCVAKGREEKEAGREPFEVWENGALPKGREAGCLGGRSAAVERLSPERLREVPATLFACPSELLKPVQRQQH